MSLASLSVINLAATIFRQEVEQGDDGQRNADHRGFEPAAICESPGPDGGAERAARKKCRHIKTVETAAQMCAEAEDGTLAGDHRRRYAEVQQDCSKGQ